MFLQVQGASFTCPECSQLVTTVVVTGATTAFTAPAGAAHAAVGHTAALCGTRWLVRCGDSRKMALGNAKMQVVSGVLVDGSVPPTSPSKKG